MLHKKKLFQSIGISFTAIVLLIASSLVPFLGQPLSAAAEVDHVTLTWESDPKTTQTITWRTEETELSGQVRYAQSEFTKSFPYNAQTLDATVERVATNLGNMNIHSVTLMGLKPGKRYVYQIREGSGWGEIRNFSTPSAKNDGFKFLVFGDSQSINYDVWRTTLQQAFKANQDVSFFTNVGDLVDVGQDYAQWDAWFKASQGVIDRIPAMPLTGNHENYTPERRFSQPVLFTAQLKVPVNGPESLRRQVYSFDYGDVHFVMLDSQIGEQVQFVPQILESQKNWLEQDLAATNKKWKIVFLHRPPYHNKVGGANSSVKRAFVPILDKYHVDVVFSGHEHDYARTYPIYNDQVVGSPGKGTIYVTTGRSGTKTYNDTAASEWNSFFYNPLDEPNYLVVEIKNQILHVKAYKQSGALIDAWSIDKNMEFK
ncbi:purple acid phosphatase family protein [Pelosinus propionicus]|uniref:Purple acid Phosphatase, N-terminal domain n=1 Tax=Pelosinus propionicus DSM 13327 TaxID=1123291 RepID=A0A1I4NEG2_9FIRM|nr:metallophosphoesterase family protein [Pelosinus propionicus]SFM13898.1 Purple acid Phosphatase, N-terminal domain [Pelosinus propionicus DSM 13327]